MVQANGEVSPAVAAIVIIAVLGIIAGVYFYLNRTPVATEGISGATSPDAGPQGTPPPSGQPSQPPTPPAQPAQPAQPPGGP